MDISHQLLFKFNTLATFHIPHITHRSTFTFPFGTLYSANYLPHAAIPHFTSPCDELTVVRRVCGELTGSGTFGQKLKLYTLV